VGAAAGLVAAPARLRCPIISSCPCGSPSTRARFTTSASAPTSGIWCTSWRSWSRAPSSCCSPGRPTWAWRRRRGPISAVSRRRRARIRSPSSFASRWPPGGPARTCSTRPTTSCRRSRAARRS
jgi:hypothetical protein